MQTLESYYVALPRKRKAVILNLMQKARLEDSTREFSYKIAKFAINYLYKTYVISFCALDEEGLEEVKFNWEDLGKKALPICRFLHKKPEGLSRKFLLFLHNLDGAFPSKNVEEFIQTLSDEVVGALLLHYTCYSYDFLLREFKK